jgi:hypothetical protein
VSCSFAACSQSASQRSLALLSTAHLHTTRGGLADCNHYIPRAKESSDWALWTTLGAGKGTSQLMGLIGDRVVYLVRRAGHGVLSWCPCAWCSLRSLVAKTTARAAAPCRVADRLASVANPRTSMRCCSILFRSAHSCCISPTPGQELEKAQPDRKRALTLLPRAESGLSRASDSAS